MPRRDAQGLSVSTLIMVALGILVLIMAIVFYNSTVEDSRSTISDCQNAGGTCQSGSACPDGQFNYKVASCGEGQVCCIGTGQNT